MADKDLASRIQSLMSEFRSSKMSIDDFLRTKLLEQRKDADTCAKKIIETFKGIDENYASLQAAKSKGVNRQEWLRERIDSAITDLASANGREVAGKVLAKSIDALNSFPAGTTQDRSFEGLDAIDTLADLDNALSKRAIDSITISEGA